jgi:hypothetical protein
MPPLQSTTHESGQQPLKKLTSLHVPVMLPQMLLMQSAARVQFRPSEHLWQVGPPQSTSVSFPLRDPSWQSTLRKVNVSGASLYSAYYGHGTSCTMP